MLPMALRIAPPTIVGDGQKKIGAFLAVAPDKSAEFGFPAYDRCHRKTPIIGMEDLAFCLGAIGSGNTAKIEDDLTQNGLQEFDERHLLSPNNQLGFVVDRDGIGGTELDGRIEDIVPVAACPALTGRLGQGFVVVSDQIQAGNDRPEPCDSRK